MRGLGVRGLRVLVLAGGSVALYAFLEPHGFGWLVFPILLGAIVLVFGIAFLSARRGRRYHRWTDALIDPEKRTTAIKEIRAERDALDLNDKKGLSGYVHLSILLSELLAANEEQSEADQTLEDLLSHPLSVGDKSRVLYTRAALALRSGDIQLAQERLEEIDPLGEPAFDLRVDLLRAVVDIEQGRAEDALETAGRVRKAKAADESVIVEARTVRASALDAMGQTKDAVAILRSLGPSVRPQLVALGHPRLKRLAQSL